MDKKRSGIIARIGVALGILFFSLPGLYTLIAHSITANPAEYLKPAAALQELLLPFYPLIESLSSLWVYLPPLVFALGVLINLFMALIVRKLPLPGLRHFTYLFLFGAILGMAVFAQAAGFIPIAENLSADPLAAVPRILVYPSAMLLHAVWQVGGIVAYLLPPFGLALALALLLSASKRKTLIARASLLYAAVLSASFVAGFFTPEALQPQLNSLMLSILPLWLSVILSLIVLLGMTEAVLRVFLNRSFLTKGAKLPERDSTDSNNQE